MDIVLLSVSLLLGGGFLTTYYASGLSSATHVFNRGQALKEGTIPLLLLHVLGAVLGIVLAFWTIGIATAWYIAGLAVVASTLSGVLLGGAGTNIGIALHLRRTHRKETDEP